MKDNQQKDSVTMTHEIFNKLRVGDYLRHSGSRGGHLVLSRNGNEVNLSGLPNPCSFESGFIVVDSNGDAVRCLMTIAGIESAEERTTRMKDFIEIWTKLEIGDALVINGGFTTVLHMRNGFIWLAKPGKNPGSELDNDTPLKWDPELATLTDRSGDRTELQDGVKVKKGKGKNAAVEFAANFQEPSLFFTYQDLNAAFSNANVVEKLTKAIGDDPTFQSIDTLALLCDLAFGAGSYTLEQLAIFAGGINLLREKAHRSLGMGMVEIHQVSL